MAELTKDDGTGAISEDALLDPIKWRWGVGARLTLPTAGRTIAKSGKKVTKRRWDENRAQPEDLQEDCLLRLAACASPRRPRPLPSRIQSDLCGERGGGSLVMDPRLVKRAVRGKSRQTHRAHLPFIAPLVSFTGRSTARAWSRGTETPRSHRRGQSTSPLHRYCGSCS